jgi:hypothetical protein
MTIQKLKCVLCSEEYEIDTEQSPPKTRCDRCPGLLITHWDKEGKNGRKD